MLRDQDLLRRISFIRYLYKIGEQQSAGPAPHSAVAILTFYDAIEWFLITACEHFDVKVKERPGIHTYFQAIEQSRTIFGTILLNKISSARSELKHRLTIPSSLSVEEVRFATKNFLEENSMQLFGVHFEAASMLDLITSEGIILHLREANSLIDTAQFEAAMGRISDAFNNLIREFQLNLMPNWALVCGADELSLYHFTRTFRQIGEKREFTIKPSFESCRFCYDLLVETAIRAEQTFAGKSRQIGSVFGYTQSRD